MTSGQEGFFLSLILFILAIIVVVMFSMILRRLPKRQQHRKAVKHRHFYSRLQEFIGGQILIGGINIWEKTGILKEIKVVKEEDGDRIIFHCIWSATRKKGKWSPYMVEDNYVVGGRYFNILGGGYGDYFFVEGAAIYQINNEDDFCLVLDNGNMVFLYHPENKYLLKIEDVEEYEIMLPTTVGNVVKV